MMPKTWLAFSATIAFAFLPPSKGSAREDVEPVSAEQALNRESVKTSADSSRAEDSRSSGHAPKPTKPPLDPAEIARELDRVSKEMSRASEQIESKETRETTGLQLTISQDLQKLIETIEQNQPPNGGGNNNRKPPDQSDTSNDRGERNQKVENEPKKGQEPAPGKVDAQDASRPGGKATDSDQQAQADLRNKETAAGRGRLAMDPWGHLPPKLREELRSHTSEKILPGFEDLVRQFYDVLSRPDGRGATSPRSNSQK